MTPRRYGPLAYVPITRRPKLIWPDGARVALWVNPNVEFFGLDDVMPSNLNDRVPRDQAGIAQLRIFGMTLDHMNQLTKAGLVWLYRKNNTVSIAAGNDQSGMTTIYKGVIFEAYPDFQTQPEVSFVVSANPGMDLQMTPTDPVSVKGAADVGTFLEQVVKPFGLKVETN